MATTFTITVHDYDRDNAPDLPYTLLVHDGNGDLIDLPHHGYALVGKDPVALVGELTDWLLRAALSNAEDEAREHAQAQARTQHPVP